MVYGNIFYVPWPDFSEWNTVKEQIFSSNVQDTIAAYHTILMWKLKYDNIPAYIECTYCLLQVMVKEYEMTKSEQNSLLFNEHDLQLSYSTALIRFINHVASINSYKGETLYLIAKTQNIPDWIISMRHDIAHGQDLPSLEALHIAAELSLKWLLENYWGNSENCEHKSMDAVQFDIDSGFPQEINTDAQNFFKKFISIWEMFVDVRFKKEKLIMELEREFMLHLEELLSLNNVYFNNVDNRAKLEIQNIVNAYNRVEENGEFEPAASTTIKGLKTLLLSFLKKVITSNDDLKHSLVLSLLETTFLLENNVNPEKWKQIIWLLQEVGSFSFLVEILFQMAGRGHKGASKWLSILPASFRVLKKQWAEFRALKKQNTDSKTKEMKKKVQRVSKAVERNLKLPLAMFKPPTITLDMVKNILLNPEHFSVDVIDGYLRLVKPALMPVTIDMIKDLVSLHMVAENKEVGDVTEDKVFTVEDLDKMLETDESLVLEEAIGERDTWVKSSIDMQTWNKCPLGLLPFQAQVNCNLPEDLTWEKKPTSRKRVSIPLLKHSVNMKKFRET